ncbi:hypothetical protein JL722_153 [Aureococcus anophagefferens]|nr:hypothetical protein JL722_153 [Aureococcus anophagefferens]
MRRSMQASSRRSMQAKKEVAVTESVFPGGRDDDELQFECSNPIGRETLMSLGRPTLRWFRIVEGRDELEWYHDSGEIESRAPCGTMALSDRVVELVPRADANGRMNCFALRRRENGKAVAGEMVLAATSAPDVANWLEALMYVTRGAGGPTMLERCRSESLRSTLSRPSLFVDDAGAASPTTSRRRPGAADAPAAGDAAHAAKVLAERSVPASLRSYYAPLDRGVAVVKDMAEDGRLSDAGARALLVEVALQNREVVAAVRDADEARLEALALKIKEINACQDHLVGRRETGKRASRARFSLYAGAAEAASSFDAPPSPPPVAPPPATPPAAPAAGSALRTAASARPRGRVRFAPVVRQRLFAYALAATVPSDGGAAIGLGRYVEDDAYDLDDFEALRGGTTALQVDAAMAAYVAGEAARLRSLDGEASDEDYSEEESDDDDDDDAEWPPAWRYPRETFQDDGAIPPGARLLAASGHRRASISLNAAQLLAIAQSRKRNSRARAARRIIDGDDPDEVMAWLADMEKAASVEAYAAHWRTTARSRAEARRVEAT